MNALRKHNAIVRGDHGSGPRSGPISGSRSSTPSPQADLLFLRNLDWAGAVPSATEALQEGLEQFERLCEELQELRRGGGGGAGHEMAVPGGGGMSVRTEAIAISRGRGGGGGLAASSAASDIASSPSGSVAAEIPDEFLDPITVRLPPSG